MPLLATSSPTGPALSRWANIAPPKIPMPSRRVVASSHPDLRMAARTPRAPTAQTPAVTAVALPAVPSHAPAHVANANGTSRRSPRPACGSSAPSSAARGTSDPHVGRNVGVGLRPDPLHLLQFFHPPETSVFGTPGQDPLGRHRADARQRVQLRRRRGVQVDLR